MDKIMPYVKMQLVALLFLSVLGCKDNMIVVADEPTKVFKSYPDSGPPKQDEVVAVLNKGETGAVIHSRHSKDFMFYKIRLKDGREGYVWVGDKFRVEKK